MEITRAALMDAVDYDPASGAFTRKTTSKWHPNSNGQQITTLDSHGYVVFKVGRTMQKAHRMAWLWHHGFLPPEHVDHINNDRSDNRIVNLRLASCKQNNENRRAGRNNVSGTVGVRQRAYGKWVAYIYHHRQNIHLGEYDTESEAIAARSTAERLLFTHAKTPPADK